MPNLSSNLSTNDDVAVGGVVSAAGFEGPLAGDVEADDVVTTNVNSRAAYTGPSFFPAASEWAGIVGWTPTWLTVGDEGSGNAKDRISTNDLTVAGTIAAYGQMRNGKSGIRITANSAGFSANVNDFANTNSVFGAWFAVEDAVASQRSYLGRYGSTIYILISVQSSGGGGVANKLHIQATDGTTAKTIALDKVMTDGIPRLVTVHIDRTMNTMRARVSAPGEAAVSGTTDITGWGTLAGGSTPLFNYGYVNGLQHGDDCWMGGAFAAIAAGRTGASVLADLHAALGVE